MEDLEGVSALSSSEVTANSTVQISGLQINNQEKDDSSDSNTVPMPPISARAYPGQKLSTTQPQDNKNNENDQNDEKKSKCCILL